MQFKYQDLIKAAILALKDPKGSSATAITKYLAANYPEASNMVALKTAIKSGLKKGIFVQVKGSYKVSPEAK